MFGVASDDHPRGHIAANVRMSSDCAACVCVRLCLSVDRSVGAITIHTIKLFNCASMSLQITIVNTCGMASESAADDDVTGDDQSNGVDISEGNLDSNLCSHKGRLMNDDEPLTNVKLFRRFINIIRWLGSACCTNVKT